MKAIDFATARACIRQHCQHDVECVENDSTRTHRLGLTAQHRQHAGEIEIACLDQIRGRLRIEEEQLLLGCQFQQVPAETAQVSDDTGGGLLEGDKHARLLEFPRAIHKELQGEYGLAGTGSAGENGGSPAWQAAARELVESRDAAGRFLGGMVSIGMGGFHEVQGEDHYDPRFQLPSIPLHWL